MAESGKSARRGWLKIVVPILLIAALVVTGRFLPIKQYFLSALTWTQSLGYWGPAVVVLFYIVACVLFLPGSVLTVGAGFIFHLFLGTVTVSIGATLGACAAFWVGRTIARGWVAKRITGKAKFAAIDEAVGREGFKIVLLTRLSPVFPFNLLNYAFGLTRVRFPTYALASWIGMLPGTIMYVYIGSAARSLADAAAGNASQTVAQKIFFWAGLAIALVVAVIVTRVARRALKQAAPAAAGELGMMEYGRVAPSDTHNEALIGNVHPSDWANPAPISRYNLVVLGAGTAGLITALGAAGLGAKVAIVERHLLGGDCLNVGCVPSKCLIRSSRVAANIQDAQAYGIRAAAPGVDFAAVMERMRRIRSRVSAHDSAQRLRELGVDVFFGQGMFVSDNEIDVNGQTLRFAKAVIATGARAVRPPVPGLDEAGFLTNETVFALTERPARLVVFGAGPLGCELAQAFRRLGSEVTIIERHDQFLAREDAEAAKLLARSFERDGIHVLLNTDVERVERSAAGKVLTISADGHEQVITADEILVGAGRAPNVEGLGLESVRVKFHNRAGVLVNDHLQTSNPRIFAAGDICLQYKFTHTADASARIVIQNALFGGRKKFSALTIPWCTYTDPEIAHVGMYERDAKERGIAIDTYAVQMEDVDRAVLDGEEEGFVKVHVRKGTDKIVGATIVARHAGEMTSEISVAMVGGVGLGTIAQVIHPYPTQAEGIKRVADAYNRTRLTPLLKRVFATWLSWKR